MRLRSGDEDGHVINFSLLNPTFSRYSTVERAACDGALSCMNIIFFLNAGRLLRYLGMKLLSSPSLLSSHSWWFAAAVYSQPLHQPSHLWKEWSGSLSWHFLALSSRWFLCLVVKGGWILGFRGLETVLRIRQRVVLAIPLTPACSNICLLVKSDCFTASRLMADVWRLDIFRFTPLPHLFRVWLALAMNLFTFLWSRHNSFAISVAFHTLSESYYYANHIFPRYFEKQRKRHIFCINVIAK